MLDGEAAHAGVERAVDVALGAEETAADMGRALAALEGSGDAQLLVAAGATALEGGGALHGQRILLYRHGLHGGLFDFCQWHCL